MSHSRTTISTALIIAVLFVSVAHAQLPVLDGVAPVLPTQFQSGYNADPYLLQLPPINASFSYPLLIASWDGSLSSDTNAGQPLQVLWFRVSRDNGQSWAAPQSLPIWGLAPFDVVWTPVLYYTANRVFIHFTANDGTAEGGALYVSSCDSTVFWDLLLDTPSNQSSPLLRCLIPKQVCSVAGWLTRGARPLSASVDPDSTDGGWHIPFVAATSGDVYIVHMQPNLALPMERTLLPNITSSSSSPVLTMSPNLASPAVVLTVLRESHVQFFATADLTLKGGWASAATDSNATALFAVAPQQGPVTLTVAINTNIVAASTYPIATVLFLTSGVGSMQTTIDVIALTADGAPVWDYCTAQSVPHAHRVRSVASSAVPLVGGISLGRLVWDATLWTPTTTADVGATPSLTILPIGAPNATSIDTALLLGAAVVVTQTYFAVASAGGDVLVGYNMTVRLNGTEAVPSNGGAGASGNSPQTATAITFVIICGVFFVLVVVLVVGHLRSKRLQQTLEKQNEGASLLKPSDMSNTSSECHTIRHF